MTLDNVVKITGNLRDAYNKAVHGTILCVDQLNRKRRTKPKLRNIGTYTGDGNVYSLDGRKKTPTLRITREVSQSPSGLIVINPVLKNIDEAFERLVNNGNYQVTPADFEVVKSTPETVTVNLTKLESMRDENNIHRFLLIDTSKELHRYNSEEQKILLRVFGPTKKDYSANMNMLRTSHQKIRETRIYFLDPDYVREKTQEGPIGLPSWLIDFSGNDSSGFNAASAIFRNSDYACIFGVRRKIATRRHDKTACCYETWLADPASAVKALDNQKVAELSRIVADYLATKVQ